MKLLVTMQAIDLDDPLLSFMHSWAEELAKRFEHVEIICLKLGRHSLPANVRVHSLGKERGRPFLGIFTYAARLEWLAWRLRKQYDAVFVHMNQEYVLIAGPMWRILGKPIYMWRNHYAGSVWTDLAAALSTKVFCTSKHSYTAHYAKTMRMPVGVNLERFYPDSRTPREPRSILFFARMTPSKRPEMLIDALAMLKEKGIAYTASFYGSPPTGNEAYYESVRIRARKLGDKAIFHPGVSNDKAPDVFRSHEIFVNCAPSGMFDKMLFEAAASGCVVIAESDDWEAVAGTDYSYKSGNAEDLATQLEKWLLSPGEAYASAQAHLREVAESHSLTKLINELTSMLR